MYTLSELTGSYRERIEVYSAKGQGKRRKRQIEDRCPVCLEAFKQVRSVFCSNCYGYNKYNPELVARIKKERQGKPRKQFFKVARELVEEANENGQLQAPPDIPGQQRMRPGRFQLRENLTGPLDKN